MSMFSRKFIRLFMIVSLTGFILGSAPQTTQAVSLTAPQQTESAGIPLQNIKQITVGDNYTCALTTTGGVKCWGDNQYDQLGDGTTIDKNTPVDVSGLSSGVAAISVGSSHTCALTAIGAVKCWGQNKSGQLGDSTTIDKNTPVDVSGLSSGVAAISAGGANTCALTTTGGVKCWGFNGSGSLGDGSTVNRSTPVDVSGLGSGVAAISTGGHTCALTTTGGVKCWGGNQYGQLGDGTTVNKNTPVNVSGLGSDVMEIKVGLYRSCTLTTTGTVKCWGHNEYGQLGDGTTVDKNLPVDVITTSIAAISTGKLFHTCALTTTGGVRCWGHNEYGQLGDGTTGSKNTPVNVIGLSSGVAAISADDGYACGLMLAGAVKCWGRNDSGQLGNGMAAHAYTPVNVDGLGSGVAAVSAGIGHTCALSTTGGVKCWGFNGKGSLGDGSTVDKNTPVDVSGLASNVTAIDVSYHTCALTITGGVKCWGSNNSGQLGDDTTIDKNIPVDVIGLGSGVAAISAGVSHSCALTTIGAVKCWGSNSIGQLGDGTTVDKNLPVDVNGLSTGVAAISAGSSYTCALTTTGGVKCWGYNGYGQLGDGTKISKNIPIDVKGLGSGVTAISAALIHTCAITAIGAAKCWGHNEYGQLGDGTAWSTTPVDVLESAPLPNVTPSNATTGAPGSRFVFSGSNFQPHTPLPVSLSPISATVVAQINVQIGAVATDASGSFTFTLATDNSMAIGGYLLEVGDSQKASVELKIDPAAALLTPPITGQLIEIAQRVFLPLVNR